MQTAWNNVETLLNEMKPLLVEAGVPERQVAMPKGREPEEIKINQYSDAFDWLHDLKMSPAWESLLRAKALLPDHAWANYKAIGIKGSREQIILERAQAGVRRGWKQNRPSFFGRTYRPKKDAT